MSTRLRKGLLASATALVLSAPAVVVLQPGAAAEPPAEPGAAGVDAPVPGIAWSRCAEIARSFCATVEVPLDYDEPTGRTITLDLVKTPALDGANRIGTMFVNPGGPGGSAREFAPWAADLLGDTVAVRYDVIGIDPRGVGPSARMRCRTEVKPPKAPWKPFPETQGESKKMFAAAMWVRDACRDGGNATVDHMSTADTARDMDLIRQAVGEDELNYYGVSYGTHLGATYAAMFPDLVGRMVLDSVVEPKAWATGNATPATEPFSTRLRSGPSAHTALKTALAECDRLGRKKCSLAPGAQQKWDKIKKRAKNGKLKVYGDRISYAELVGFSLSEMYSTYGYDFLAMILTDIYNENFKRSTPRSAQSLEAGLTADELRERAQEIMRAPYLPVDAHAKIDVGDAFLGVACADTDNPSGRTAWWQTVKGKPAGGFGSLWTWASASCSKWRASAKADRFAGPWDVATANPVLVTGNIHDPATGFWAAKRLTQRLTGSRLLQLNGYGHGALGNSCVTAAFDAYYLDGTLPDAGAQCEPDWPLFGNLDGAATQRAQGWVHSDRAKRAS